VLVECWFSVHAAHHPAHRTYTACTDREKQEKSQSVSQITTHCTYNNTIIIYIRSGVTIHLHKLAQIELGINIFVMNKTFVVRDHMKKNEKSAAN